MHTLLRLLRLLRPLLPLLALSMVFNLLFSVFSAGSIALVKPLLESVLGIESSAALPMAETGMLTQLKDNFYKTVAALVDSPNPEDKLINLGILLIVVFGAKAVVKYTSSNLNLAISEGVVKTLRDTVFSRLLKQPLGYFHANKAGAILSHVTNDVPTVNSFVQPLFQTILREPVEVLLYLGLLYAISPSLLLVSMTSSVVSLLLIQTLRKSVRRRAERVQAAAAEYTAILQESVAGIRVVKTYGLEKIIDAVFSRQTQHYRKSVLRHERVTAIAPAVSELLAIIALSVVIVYGGMKVLSGEMGGDELMTFVIVVFAVMSPLTSLLGLPTRIQLGMVATERIFSLIDKHSDERGGRLTDISFNKSIRLNDLTFAYAADPVLDGVSIDIPKGTTAAFVGASGSGKSTAADLLLRFYNPLQGSVEIDERDIRDYDIAAYRSLFGMVAQDSFLFNDTVRANIRYGNLEATDEQIEEAATLANAHGFITELPEGYNTVLGDRGVSLSGGQRQRIAIARALVRKPEILVFDEATSALDSESEHVVQAAIQKVLKGRTAIVIAHRLSTVVDADCIYVFDKGKVVEKGTHQQLLAANGIYKNLFDIQYKSAQAEG